MTLSARIRIRLSPVFTLDARLEVAAGMTMVFGASGSGKTTLLRAIAGLALPEAGRVAVGGTVFFDMPRLDISSSQIRRRIAQGAPIRYLVPDPVAERIARGRLYR